MGLREAFQKLDTNKNGVLERSEWEEFIHLLGMQHLQYLLCGAHLECRAFYGHGQRWLASEDGVQNPTIEELKSAAGKTFINSSGQLSLRKLGLFQASVDKDAVTGVIPVGLWPDLCYYSANNHPLHGIFCCDPNHRLRRSERVFMEVVTCCFIMWSAAAKHACCENKVGCVFSFMPFSNLLERPQVFDFVIITLGGIIVWWALFLCFTTPKCGQVDLAVSDVRQIQSARKCSLVGDICGYGISVLGFLAFAWRVHRAIEFSDIQRLNLASVVVGRITSYVFAWVLMVVFYFNPFLAWGQPDPSGSLCIGDYIGVGQWRIEKQRFQALCIHAVDKFDCRDQSLQQGSFATGSPQHNRVNLRKPSKSAVRPVQA